MILAFDLGSTNFKAALFDDALERIGQASLPTPYLHNDGERVELDANDVRETVVNLTRAACRSAGVHTNTIASVAVTSQAQSFTVLDGAGKARMPVISWLDTRSADEACELWTAYGSDWHQHCSFATLNGQMQLAHLLWTRRHRPDVFDDDSHIVTLPGLVFHMLAGINLTDQNLAAMSGTYSLLAQGWRVDALTSCGVLPAQMPRLVPVGTPISAPTACPALDLRGQITLISAGNDQTAGAFGNGCREDEIIVTLGTALVAYRHTGAHPGPYSANGCWGPYPRGGYYELAVSNSGCLALNWARQVLMPGADLAQFDAAVAEVVQRETKPTGTFDPARIRTPNAWQGSFADVNEKAYAVLEGIAVDLRRLVSDDLSCAAGARLRAIGGGSRSKVWLQIIADVLNCSVRAGSGDSLVGAARMALGNTQHRNSRGVYRALN